MRERLTALWVAIVLLSGWASAGDPIFREVEITSDPPENGKQIFTIRMTPATTQNYDKLTVDCTYHQEFSSQATDRTGENRTNEPAFFTYRRKEFKIVDELDCYVSFRVPVAMNMLTEIYGLTAFNTNAPVSVSRLRITAFQKDTPSWSFVLPSSGLHKNPQTAAYEVPVELPPPKPTQSKRK